MTSRERGLNALKLWYQGSALRYQYTFDQVVAYYDQKSPTFISNLGGAVKDSELSQDEIEIAFSHISQQMASGFPHQQSFFEALAGKVVGFRFENVTEAFKKTASQVKTAAIVGLGAYGLWIIGGLVLTVIIAEASSKRRAAA
jgi:hypothetical protein